jgi:hypothetical protein
MKARFPLSFVVVLLLAFGVAVGCNQVKAKPDSQVSSEIQNKFNQDSGLQGKQLTVQAANGVITLDGTVDNQNEREAAARLAASVDGVKTVVNNLQVGSAPETAAAPAPPPPQEEPKPEPRRRASKPRRPSSASSVSTDVAPPAPAPSAAPSNHIGAAPSTMDAMNTAPSTPPPPQKVTIPSGTTMAIRLVDGIDSETSQPGQTFRATLDSPLAVEGEPAIPAGYDIEGHIVDVKSAGKFAGQSLLVLQLDRIAVGKKYYNIQTDQYRREGTSRGKSTAKKVGAGAAIGAIIGGIAGGGKGAAIGAAAGGGLGGGVQAATKGQQIKLPSETVLNFTLQGPLTVIPTSEGPNSGRPKLGD